MQGASRDKHRREQKETLGKVIMSNLLSLLKIFSVCLIIIYLCMNFVVRPITIMGESMYPTLKRGEFAISNSFASKFLEIDYGDVVIAYEDKIFHKNIIKRVIAKPGDTIACHNDKIYVNGVAIDESYLNNDFVQNIRDTDSSLKFNGDFDEIVLADDEYWLMGDNRINSTDSRKFGPVKKSNIKGVGIIVIFPFDKIRVVE